MHPLPSEKGRSRHGTASGASSGVSGTSTAGESISRMGGPLLAAEDHVWRRSTHGTKIGLPVLLSTTVSFAATSTVDRSASWDDPSWRMTSLVDGSAPSASSTRAAAQKGV